METQNLFLAYVQGFGQGENGRPIIAFYGIIIVFGALLALFTSNYRAHKDGFGWDFFDTVFLVAFPCGIIGARIWYIIASWKTEFLNVFQYSGFGAGMANLFDMRSGGLAIQGGAIFGVLAALIFCKFRRKGTPLLKIADFAVPTILIGQGIGRWGNFFNQEVFGRAVSPDAWDFVPSWIMNNMQNGKESMLSGVVLPSGSVAVPLFLVESILDLCFFFLVAYGIKAVEGKHYKDGDETFGYFLSYGIIRMLMEPLRNPLFIMGEGGTDALSRSQYKSFWMGLAFILVGILLIVLNHVVRHFCKPQEKKPEVVLSSSTSSGKKEESAVDDLESLVRKKEEEKHD